MDKKDKKHVEELIAKGYYTPGLFQELIKLQLGVKLDRIERMLEFIILESRLRDIQEYLDKIPSWRHVNERGADDAEMEHLLKCSVVGGIRDKVWEENQDKIRVFEWLHNLGMRLVDVIYKKESIGSKELIQEILGNSPDISDILEEKK
jgi:hypothetical protein